VKMLITGATGFVGSGLVAALNGLGCSVVPVVRRSAGMTGEIIVTEIDGQSEWGCVVSGCNTVIHLAARVHVMVDELPDPLGEYRRVNVQGTLNLARNAAQSGVRRFVFMSSIKVNGEHSSTERPLRDDDVPAPEDAYGQSKLEAEQGLVALSRETGMEIVIIRPPLVYGPGVKGNFAQMVRWLRSGMPLPLGAIHNRRSLVALDNLVDFIALCADVERSPLAANQVFLISDDEDVSTTELLRKVGYAYGVTPRLLPVPVHLIQSVASALGKRIVADRLLGSLVVDISKAQELLGWRPVVSMDEQLKKMALHDSGI
jgi:nucleoside-diphosphate-sugar epimerase